MGAAALGRFAYAVLVVEFAAQIAALGLRRGLAQLLSDAKKPQACVVADALLVAAVGSAVGMAILFLFPEGDVSDDHRRRARPAAGDHRDRDLLDRHRARCAGLSSRRGIDRPRAFDRRAMDYQHRRLRAVIRPIMVSRGDGLIIAYVLSMVAAMIAALIPLFRCYGMPHGWKPDLGTAWATAVRNAPLAAADTVEWASRRIDLAVFGAFLPQASSESITPRSRSRPCPPSSRPASSPCSAQRSSERSRRTIMPGLPSKSDRSTYWIIAAQPESHWRWVFPDARSWDWWARLHRRHRDAWLPARCGGHRRGSCRQRSGAHLRRAQAQHAYQPRHAGARGGPCSCLDPPHEGRGSAARPFRRPDPLSHFA